MMTEEHNQFIETWGSMGVLWGINRSMARIHAFVMLNEEPVDLETVSEELNISRGNASMSLKELRNWGVIHRVHISGDRRDFYVAEPDIWKMLFSIARVRKEREFDPALDALRNLLSDAGLDRGSGVYTRMNDLEKSCSKFDRIMMKALGNEKRSRMMLDLLTVYKD
jgi:DNA-binding transcriptional regulator GbsR (MarR family)